MTGDPNPEAARLLSQMADINGLDTIGWWPLAPGWWALITLSVCLVIAAAYIHYRKRKYRNSWKQDTADKLSVMTEMLNELTIKEIANELSALLRRIAIRRHSRAECAGLEGQAWLEWLKNHDPKGFDWRAHAALLTQLPYAPSTDAFSPAEVRTLIDATKEWIR